MWKKDNIGGEIYPSWVTGLIIFSVLACAGLIVSTIIGIIILI